jgi:hypothetical protein
LERLLELAPERFEEYQIAVRGKTPQQKAVPEHSRHFSEISSP